MIKALKLEQDNIEKSEILEEMGYVAQEKGDHDAAIEFYTEVIEYKSGNDFAHWCRCQ